MLLRLVPDTSLPVILFNVAFQNPPEQVPFPQNWQFQLQTILDNELDFPQHLHALDKAVWAVSLLDEVVFNVAKRYISCIFVDGSRCEWPLRDMCCLRALHDVIDDVDVSATMMEAEKLRRNQAISSSPASSRPASPSPVKATKHKKSRSILMALVSSLVPSRPSSPAISEFDPESLPSTPLPSPSIQSIPTHVTRKDSARFYRHRARASLVNVFRRFILPELPHAGTYSEGNGYVVWVLQSMLQRIDYRMEELLRLIESTVSEGFAAVPRGVRISPSALSESPFEDDEASTDGSSVHTPQDSFPDRSVLVRTPSSDDDPFVDAENGFAGLHEGTPRSKDARNKSDDLFCQQQTERSQAEKERTLLHATAHRLRALLYGVEQQERITVDERSAQLAVLEVKSRRRAWSSCDLMGRAEMRWAGLATPGRGSCLKKELKDEQDRIFLERGRKKDRLGAVRLGTISENESDFPKSGAREGSEDGSEDGVPQDVRSDESDGLSAYPLQVPALRVPFPYTSDEDDFCSTGPQDTLPLFAHPTEAETEQDLEIDLEAGFAPHLRNKAGTACEAGAPGGYVRSYDTYTGRVTYLNSPSPSPSPSPPSSPSPSTYLSQASISSFSPARSRHLVDQPAVPYNTYSSECDSGFDELREPEGVNFDFEHGERGCDEFTLTLDLKATVFPGRQRTRLARSRCFSSDDAMSRFEFEEWAAGNYR